MMLFLKLLLWATTLAAASYVTVWLTEFGPPWPSDKKVALISALVVFVTFLSVTAVRGKPLDESRLAREQFKMSLGWLSFFAGILAAVCIIFYSAAVGAFTVELLHGVGWEVIAKTFKNEQLRILFEDHYEANYPEMLSEFGNDPEKIFDYSELMRNRWLLALSWWAMCATLTGFCVLVEPLVPRGAVRELR